MQINNFITLLMNWEIYNENKSSLSESSKSFKDQNSNINNRWAAQLLKSVQNVTNKNKLKYEAIVKHNSEFSMKLYTPCLSSLPQKIQKINGELLMKQLDALLQDECKLDKQINKINFEKQEHELLRQIQIESQMDHYSFLRAIWKRTDDRTNIEDRIQRLSKNVGSIKGHIKSLIKEQNKVKNFSICEAVIESKEYEILKESYERLMMSKEDRKVVLEQEQKKKAKEIENVQQENKRIRKKLEEEKEKYRKLEKELILLREKNSQLNINLMQKNNELSKFTKEYQYIYESKNNVLLLLHSPHILDKSKFQTKKQFTEIHQFLISEQQLQKDERQFSKINLQRDSKLLQNRFTHLKVDENSKKVRHIRGINQMKSADFKRPKFIRSGVSNEEIAEQKK